MEFYTIKIQTPRGKIINIRHCSKDGNLYLVPVKYRNGDLEHVLVENPEEEIGFEYMPVDLGYLGCHIMSIFKE